MWPLRVYFALLVLVFIAAAAAAAIYVHVQTGDDARRAAGRDAEFSSRVAAIELGKQVALLKESVASLAANSQLPAVFDKPKGCTLTYGASGPNDLGHIDLIRADGQVVCTSRPKQAHYATGGWFADASKKTLFLAPVRDDATGKWMAVSAAPIGDKGVVAGFMDLEELGPNLAELYGGGRKGVFSVLSADNRVLARSLEPKRWIGERFQPTLPARTVPVEARGLDGVTRIAVGTKVGDTGWHLFAALDKSAALDDARRLERRELLIILLGLGAILAAAVLVYRSVARPITQLASAVRSAEAGDPAPVVATGPKEVRELGNDVGNLLWAVQRELTERERAEEQLRQAQKMEAVGELAGGIAHDFNNVLMVIRAHAATMLKRSPDEASAADLEKIDSAAQRAADLTRQLLAFSRRQVLRPEVTNLDEVITDTLALLHRLLGEHIEIVAELEPDLRPVVVDRSQLGQVILNLAVNARDAMPSGGTIHIKTANVDVDEGFAREHVDLQPGPHVLLQVTDSGAGMSEETRERAFDPFFTTKTDGTGLGLATVYGIVKQSGGDIWLYSEPGVGTTFKIYLPSADASAVTQPEAPAAPSYHGTETVLLVEDEDLLRPLLAESLRAFGYTVVAAASGPEALELAKEHEFDAVITDVVMPVMNGRELAERLTADRPGLRVLFTSGYPSDTIIRQGIASATAEYIEKPYLPEDLAAKLRQVLDGTG